MSQTPIVPFTLAAASSVPSRLMVTSRMLGESCELRIIWPLSTFHSRTSPELYPAPKTVPLGLNEKARRESVGTDMYNRGTPNVKSHSSTSVEFETPKYCRFSLNLTPPSFALLPNIEDRVIVLISQICKEPRPPTAKSRLSGLKARPPESQVGLCICGLSLKPIIRQLPVTPHVLTT